MTGQKSEALEEMRYCNLLDLGSIGCWKHGFATPFGFQPSENYVYEALFPFKTAAKPKPSAP